MPGPSITVRRDLAPAGPIGRLDRAFVLVRAAGLASAARAWGAGAPVAGTWIALYYVERVEGVRALRPFFALALVLAWWWRAQRLGAIAREHVRALWDAAPIPEGAGAPMATLRTAGWTAIGLWCWGWLVAGAAFGGPLAVIATVPLFALRGAIAPSWIARAACTDAAGLRAMRGAIADSAGQRAHGLLAELALLLGALALFVDLWVAIAAALVLGRSFLGLELALLDAFLSVRNTFVLLVLGTGALVLVEPIRAALSAVTWVDARVREEGLDLRIAIDEAIAHASARRPRIAGAFAIALLLGAPSVTRAQPPPALPPPPIYGLGGAAEDPEPIAGPGALAPTDAEALAEAERVLARPEFREFADLDGRGVRDLIERLIEWFLRHRDPIDPPPAPTAPLVALPGPLVFLVGGVLVLAALIAIAVITRPRRARPRPAATPAAAATPAVDPRERPPEQWIDDAAALAARGLYREALRALYLATLVALDRRRLIRFDPTLTNGQYLRQMPEGDARRAFRDFTRAFDRTFYGLEPAGEGEYRSARALADRIVAGDREAGQEGP